MNLTQPVLAVLACCLVCVVSDVAAQQLITTDDFDITWCSETICEDDRIGAQGSIRVDVENGLYFETKRDALVAALHQVLPQLKKRFRGGGNMYYRLNGFANDVHVFQCDIGESRGTIALRGYFMKRAEALASSDENLPLLYMDIPVSSLKQELATTLRRKEVSDIIKARDLLERRAEQIDADRRRSAQLDAAAQSVGFIDGAVPQWYEEFQEKVGLVLAPQVDNRAVSVAVKSAYRTQYEQQEMSGIKVISVVPQGPAERAWRGKRGSGLLLGIGKSKIKSMQDLKTSLEAAGIFENSGKPVTVRLFHDDTNSIDNLQIQPKIRSQQQVTLNIESAPAWCGSKVSAGAPIPVLAHDASYRPANGISMDYESPGQSESVLDDATGAVLALGSINRFHNEARDGLEAVRSRFWREYPVSSDLAELGREYSYWLAKAHQAKGFRQSVRGTGMEMLLLDELSIGSSSNNYKESLYEFFVVNPCSPMLNPDGRQFLHDLVRADLFLEKQREPQSSDVQARIRSVLGSAVSEDNLLSAISAERNTTEFVKYAERPDLVLVGIRGRIDAAEYDANRKEVHADTSVQAQLRSLLGPPSHGVGLLSPADGAVYDFVVNNLGNSVTLGSESGVSSGKFDLKLHYHKPVLAQEPVVFWTIPAINQIAVKPARAAGLKGEYATAFYAELASGTFLDAYAAMPILEGSLGQMIRQYHVNRPIADSEQKELARIALLLFNEGPLLLHRDDQKYLPILLQNISNDSLKISRDRFGIDVERVEFAMFQENVKGPMLIVYVEKGGFSMTGQLEKAIYVCEYDGDRKPGRALPPALQSTTDLFEIYEYYAALDERDRRYRSPYFKMLEDMKRRFACGSGIWHLL